MDYPSSENKGADQLLFSPMQIVDFPTQRLICVLYLCGLDTRIMYYQVQSCSDHS